MNQPNHKTEFGSEFHWQEYGCVASYEWPKPSIYFATGREALLSAMKQNAIHTLHVPDFFCNKVTDWWQNNGLSLSTYRGGPHLQDTVIFEHAVKPQEAVLAVNFFGVNTGDFWTDWQMKRPGIYLIEDHTHDPVSNWAINSTADFAFASIRKTLPIPDAAILWSPKNRSLPNEPTATNWEGSAHKLAAMHLKRDYLKSGNPTTKEVFRDLQLRGEKEFGNASKLSIAPWSRDLLSQGYPKIWRTNRERNTKTLLQSLIPCENFSPLYSDWPSGHCPLGAVLLFSSHAMRERYRLFLIKKNIFPAIHWMQNENKPTRLVDFSKRILTIPTDHRYEENNMLHIANTINDAKAI